MGHCYQSTLQKIATGTPDLWITGERDASLPQKNARTAGGATREIIFPEPKKAGLLTAL